MIRLIFFVIALTLLSSCISLYDIAVNDDGTAFVKTGRFSEDDINRYYRSSIISDIDTNCAQLNFKISNIDSLGYYLPLLQPGFIQFKKNNHELNIEDGNTENAFSLDYQSIIRINLWLHFNQEINLKYAKGRVNKKGKNVYITKSRRKLIKGDKKMQAVIEFMPTK